MITRIEIDGFKSFHNFSVDLRPFQVFIGPNGAGKSNFFDAIILLSDLANDNTLYETFSRNRGEVGELFSAQPEGIQTRAMSFAVEVLIDKKVTDYLGVEAEVSSTRLRYEIKIESRLEDGFERLYVVHELLRSIIGKADNWADEIIPNQEGQKRWIIRSKGRRGPYLSTSKDGQGNIAINKHQDGRSGKQAAVASGRFERTALSTISTAEYPTAYAVRQEMLKWRFLQLNPLALREPTDVRLSHEKTELSADASNLAAVLWRMSRENEFVWKDVSLDMAAVVPGIRDIRVELLREREKLLIEAEMTDDSKFSSRVLSDGTLRILALVTLKYDPMHRGVLCFEEPENGVHPKRLEKIVRILQSLATDFENADETSLRQILVNTHSVKLLSYTEFSNVQFVVMPSHYPRWTRMVPVGGSMFPLEEKGLQYVTLNEVRQALDMTQQEDSLRRLNDLADMRMNS